jgi:hypothetical protein
MGGFRRRRTTDEETSTLTVELLPNTGEARTPLDLVLPLLCAGVEICSLAL